MTKNEFIERIGNAAVSYYKEYQILPSLTIAQAIIESNWGKSGLSKDCHNYFGMKWKEGCGCDYKEYKTKEQNRDGSYITITAKFRKYLSLEEGIRGYYQFLQYKRYQNLKDVTDYEKACDLIRQDGWATSLSYSQTLKKTIKKYDLDVYDLKVLGVKEDGFKPGTYTVTASALKVRKGAGTNYAQKEAKDTIGAQSNVLGKAVYKKGAIIEISEVIRITDEEIWGKTVDGYVALVFDEKKYIK